MEDSALLKGILTSSLPGVFSTTRFMATPSVACRIFPLPARTNQHRQQHTEEVFSGQSDSSVSVFSFQVSEYLWAVLCLAPMALPPSAS